MLSFVKNHKFIFFFVGLATAGFLSVSILQAANYKRVDWGIRLAGQNIGGLKYEAAKEKIDSLIEQAKKQPIELRYQNKQWTFLPEELGISFKPDQTLQNTFNVGRQKQDSIFGKMVDQIQALFGKKQQNLSFKHNKQKILNFVQNNLSLMESPAKNARLVYDATTDDFSFVPAQAGEIFDNCDLTNQIDQQIATFSRKPIEIKKIVQQPTLTQDKNDIANIQAKKIIGLAPYLLKNGNDSWPIEKQILLDWLDFIPLKNQGQTMATVISEAAVKDFLSQLAPSINKEAVNAKLLVQDGKVIAFDLSQKGFQLQIDESAKKISEGVQSGQKEINLLVKKIEPEISTQTIDTLGLTNLLGIGTSSFAGSPNNRIHNISVGAAKLSGILLEPGQEFSFIENIGEIETDQGYLPELVIKNNKTIPEYGGGLCQISTTLFRAAINAGLKITERYPHAFPVRYYNPQGFDATVYPPHPDLRFLNDTPGNILIQPKIKGTQITFEIYGTKDNREVRVLGPTILQSNSDGSMKTVLYQEIWRDGVLEKKDTFWSNYRSPALYPTVRNPLE
ncbi:MAG: hypothetical protein AUJ32_01205 [Parcubacteria group bacterium CG1_02_40_82]|uniref:YoaR-like putative peptidoglycan binding domain-containing protein n=1 Tax=Candidatus Portnoybacteria bacterium CG_4_9_14_3_um_filter_40_10 TaxID=1974804 RepID=A0A2M7YPA4_9BACT|nr:MAG: hypothetical protein AUJ32_01205 [Parcubacteria group bacterium CG1_02_40_82]PJA64810.1 MAG: hypothetical protein CO159_01090 [Candidatus Portnoybacteria bacterium CG_4_9_14_3_um_filter_40_10]